MTSTRLNRQAVAIDDYAMAVVREVTRLCRRRPPCDADDIAQTVAARFLADPQRVMAKYADPVRYARAATRNTAISHDRCERAQRGEGVRLVDGSDGMLAPRRQYVSGNARPREGGAELFDAVVDGGKSFTDRIVDALDDADQLERLFAGISAADRDLYLYVHGSAHTVHEAAELLGQRRETVSRRISRIRLQIDQNRVGMTQNAQERTS